MNKLMRAKAEIHRGDKDADGKKIPVQPGTVFKANSDEEALDLARKGAAEFTSHGDMLEQERIAKDEARKAAAKRDDIERRKLARQAEAADMKPQDAKKALAAVVAPAEENASDEASAAEVDEDQQPETELDDDRVNDLESEDDQAQEEDDDGDDIAADDNELLG